MENVFAVTERIVQNAQPLCKCPEQPENMQAINEICIGRTAGHGWAFQLAHKQDSPRLITDEDYRHFQLYGDKEQLAMPGMQFLLRTALECRFCYEGIVSLHAACVDMGDCAIAFTGRSGLGKSTRANAWIERFGAEWISGDRPAVALETQGAKVLGVPWDGKEQIFRNVEKPLKCILEVRRSPDNYVRRLSAEQARELIMKQSFVPMWDTDAAVMAMGNVWKLVRQAPIYRAFCGPTAADAQEIYDILFNHPERIREEAKDMKIKEGFVLRNVVDEFIVMPTGGNISKFEGAVVLNDVSAFVFRELEKGISREDLLAAMLSEYDVDEARAAQDLDALLEQFESMGILEK